jgi:hypothetical protein
VSRTDLSIIIASAFQGRLPDMRNNLLLGQSLPGKQAGQVFGSERHQLSQEEMPSHQHGLQASLAGANSAIGSLSSFGLFGTLFAPPSNLVALATGIVQNSGSSSSHDNMQPFFVMDSILYCSETCTATINNTQCVCDLMTGYCSVQTLPAVPLVVNGPTVIPNNLTLPPSSTIVVNASSGGIITVNGTAVLGGTLTVVVSSSQSVTVLTATSVTGNFVAVNVVPNYQNCGGVQGTASYTSSTVSVTIQDPGCPSPNKALIIGLVVGLVVVFATVAAIVGVIIHRNRNRAEMRKVRSKVSDSQASTTSTATISL